MAERIITLADRGKARRGRLVGIAQFLSAEPRPHRAFGAVSPSEAELSALLEREVGDRGVCLHDLRLPRAPGPIDHVVIGPSGVWVVDARQGSGRVTVRDVGALLKPERRLFVAGRDRSSLAAELGWQLRAVRAAVADHTVPVIPALCFIGAEWGLFPKLERFRGVWVCWPERLADLITIPGALEASHVHTIARRLSLRLLTSTG